MPRFKLNPLITEKLIQLSDMKTIDVSKNKTIYGSLPKYYDESISNSFSDAKIQLLSLIDQMVLLNKDAFELALGQSLRGNVEGLLADNLNDSKIILIALKKTLEALFILYPDQLIKIEKNKISDLIFNECYPGAYSNVLLLMDRVALGGSLNLFVLLAKKEAIKQLAFNFIDEKNLSRGSDWEVHDVNRLYNYVCHFYHLNEIFDIFSGRVTPRERDAFLQYLEHHLTVDYLINMLEALTADYFPEKINHIGIKAIEQLLPEDEVFKTFWNKALYQFVLEKGSFIALDIHQTKRLLLLKSLEYSGYIKGTVCQITLENQQKIYQTKDNFFIQETINDDVLDCHYPMIRLLKENDFEKVKSVYQTLDQSDSFWFLALPVSFISKLIAENKIMPLSGFDDYLSLFNRLLLLPSDLRKKFSQSLEVKHIDTIANWIQTRGELCLILTLLEAREALLLLRALKDKNKLFSLLFILHFVVDIFSQLDDEKRALLFEVFKPDLKTMILSIDDFCLLANVLTPELIALLYDYVKEKLANLVSQVNQLNAFIKVTSYLSESNQEKLFFTVKASLVCSLYSFNHFEKLYHALPDKNKLNLLEEMRQYHQLEVILLTNSKRVIKTLSMLNKESLVFLKGIYLEKIKSFFASSDDIVNLFKLVPTDNWFFIYEMVINSLQSLSVVLTIFERNNNKHLIDLLFIQMKSGDLLQFLNNKNDLELLSRISEVLYSWFKEEADYDYYIENLTCALSQVFLFKTNKKINNKQSENQTSPLSNFTLDYQKEATKLFFKYYRSYEGIISDNKKLVDEIYQLFDFDLEKNLDQMPFQKEDRINLDKNRIKNILACFVDMTSENLQLTL